MGCLRFLTLESTVKHLKPWQCELALELVEIQGIILAFVEPRMTLILDILTS